jgi:hypothetical protein
MNEKQLETERARCLFWQLSWYAQHDGTTFHATFSDREPILEVTLDQVFAREFSTALMHGADAPEIKNPLEHVTFSDDTVFRMSEIWALNYMPNDLDVSSVDMARAEEIIGLGGETCAKSSATPITADCAPRRSFHRTLDRVLRNAGFKGNDDGPRTV